MNRIRPSRLATLTLAAAGLLGPLLPAARADERKPPSGTPTAAETRPAAEHAAGSPDQGRREAQKDMAAHDHAAHDHGVAAAVPTIHAEVRPKSSPGFQAGVATPAVLRLTRLADGQPVTPADLTLAHTKKIHLLIVDQSLGHYTHEHPVETGTPGEYTFTWTPRAGGTFHVWADLLPAATDEQEYAPTTVQVAGPAAKPERTVNRTAVVDGYRFDLATEENAPLRAGDATLVTVKVTAPDGQPFAKLEPLMGAFAHGVGFPEDLSGVVHVHPMGEEPTREEERGGPELSFHLLPEHAGFQKFYVQVQIEGKDRYAGFGLNVEPPTPAPAAAAAHSHTGHATAASAPAAPGDFLAGYEAVRAALADDNLAGAKTAAARLPADDADAKTLAASADLKSARQAFGKMSARAVPLAAGRPDLHVIRCPMTPINNGRWVQRTKEVSNPYHGKSMLECGVVER